MVGILAICGNEPTDDLRVIHMLSRLGLEAYSTACENHLTITVSAVRDGAVEVARASLAAGAAELFAYGTALVVE